MGVIVALLLLFVILIVLGLPRILLAIFWLFTDFTTNAFDGWVWPLIGWLILPWTTLACMIVYLQVDTVFHWWGLLVILGFLFDLGSYAKVFGSSDD